VFESQAFFDNSYEHINGHGDPDLGLDAAVRSAEKVFDAQMLFDPFEEEFDLRCPIGYLTRCSIERHRQDLQPE
jgi:hypothetical protein